MSEDKNGRFGAERVALVISVAIVAAILAAIASTMPGRGEDGVRFTLELAGMRPEGDEHHVLVRIRNDGRDTVENAQVIATLRLPGEEPVEAEQQVQFLAGGAEEEIVFVFPDDPHEGELELRVASYTLP